MKRAKRTVAAASMTLAALTFAAAAYFGSGCELIVQLDRGLADAGPDDIVLGQCPICTPLEGGDDGDSDASTDASDATTATGDASLDAAKDAADTGAD